MPAVLRKLLLGFWPTVGIVAAVCVALPVLTVLASVFADSDGEWRHLYETRLLDYVTNTLLLAGGVCGITVVVGTGTAWLTTLCDFPGRSFFRWALLLPLAVPAYLGAYAYTDWLQYSGPLQSGLRELFDWETAADYWFPNVRTLPGAIVILSLALYPYVYLAARTAFLEQSGCALEVARTLGRGPWRSFWSVALPLARPSIVAGAALVLMETVAEFGAVEYCAVDTFATGIYRTWLGQGSITAAAQLSAVLLGAVALLVIVELISRRNARFHQATQRYRVLPSYRLSWLRSTLAIAACGLPILLGFAIPAALFAQMAWQSGDARAVELFADHAKNTLTVAAVASLLAATLALAIAYGRRLRPGLATLVPARLASLGYAVPGAVIAIGLLIPLTWLDFRINRIVAEIWGREHRPGLILTGSIVAVVIGYQTRFLAVALAMIEASLDRVRTTLDDAARTLGAGGRGVLLRVHLPLLRGSVLAAVLLVFVDVVKELPATLILRPFNFDTLAVRVYQLASDERLEEAATGALAIILAGLIPVIVLSKLVDRSRPGATNGNQVP